MQLGKCSVDKSDNLAGLNQHCCGDRRLSHHCRCRMPSQAKVDRSANQCLSFNIIPAAPKLEVGYGFRSRVCSQCLGYIVNVQLVCL